MRVPGTDNMVAPVSKVRKILSLPPRTVQNDIRPPVAGAEIGIPCGSVAPPWRVPPAKKKTTASSIARRHHQQPPLREKRHVGVTCGTRARVALRAVRKSGGPAQGKGIPLSSMVSARGGRRWSARRPRNFSVHGGTARHPEMTEMTPRLFRLTWQRREGGGGSG
ncbi:hypothetical protein NL676_033570 [Syzygium grande]|nr:hypothetical protein NL676_033570 [Syzygium grande]